jgi:hypothetical protein
MSRLHNDLVNWTALETELTTELVKQTRQMMAEHPTIEFSAAAVGQLYYETDGVIHVPLLGLNTDGEISELPGDWEFYPLDWLPTSERTRQVHQALRDEACRSSVQHWHDTLDEFLAMLVRVCQRARQELDGLPVFIYDDNDPRFEYLLRGTLTEAEVAEHFPELNEAQAERTRVAALPLDEQVAFYVSVLADFQHPLGFDEAAKALRAMGSDAIPALLPLLPSYQAAKLLADIGIADDTAITALAATLDSARGPEQHWAAAALSRLGRLDVVLARVSALPAEVVVGAVAAPYGSFRDGTLSPRPLDYEPLESFLSGYPEMVPLLERQLAPGSSYCEITAAEAGEAIRGSASPYPLVRQHAVCVLGERALGEAVGARVMPLLARIATQDPDADVRRLAGLSLSDWTPTRE